MFSISFRKHCKKSRLRKSLAHVQFKKWKLPFAHAIILNNYILCVALIGGWVGWLIGSLSLRLVNYASVSSNLSLSEISFLWLPRMP